MLKFWKKGNKGLDSTTELIISAFMVSVRYYFKHIGLCPLHWRERGTKPSYCTATKFTNAAADEFEHPIKMMPCYQQIDTNSIMDMHIYDACKYSCMVKEFLIYGLMRTPDKHYEKAKKWLENYLGHKIDEYWLKKEEEDVE